MSEYRIQCINPGCAQPPRPARSRSNLCDPCFDRTRQNLEQTADLWTDLVDRLASESSGMTERVKGTKQVGLTINERVSDTMRDITAWAWFAARIIMENPQLVTGPKTHTTDDVLRFVSKHLTWLADHSDAELAAAVCDDAFAHLKAGRRAAYPSGARRVDLPVRCTEYGTSDLGERIPCEGTMFAIVSPMSYSSPDLICSEDDNHRVDPAVWRHVSWTRRNMNRAAAGNLVQALTGDTRQTA